MEQVEGGSVDPSWFAGLPGWMWLMIAAVLLSVGVVLFTMSLARMSNESDLRVRGWENRPKSTEAGDEWWAREYPEYEDEVG
jgi:hypothetical protein